MEEYMTTKEIVRASRDNIQYCIDRKLFYRVGEEMQDEDNDENIYTIISLWCQWAKDKTEAEEAVWRMFEKEFAEYNTEN